MLVFPGDCMGSCSGKVAVTELFRSSNYMVSAPATHGESPEENVIHSSHSRKIPNYSEQIWKGWQERT